jgi:hypothetical protein
MDWFVVQDYMREVQLHVDFEPAPDLKTIERAFLAAQREAWTYCTILAGERPGTYDVSVEGLYIPRDSERRGLLMALFDRPINNLMYEPEYVGWEWFDGTW